MTSQFFTKENLKQYLQKSMMKTRNLHSHEQLSISRYEEILSKYKNTNHTELIIGTDQNFDYLKINEHKYTSNLFDMHISHGFLPTITRPTRITHTPQTLIDNIYTNITPNNNFTSGIILTQLSDHLPVFMFIGPQIKSRQNKYTANSAQNKRCTTSANKR